MEKKGGGFSAHGWEIHRQAKSTSVSLIATDSLEAKKFIPHSFESYCWRLVRALLLRHNMAWAALDDSQREYSDSDLSFFFFFLIFYYVYIHICLFSCVGMICMCECRCSHGTIHIWRLGDNSWESGLSFHRVE